MIATGLELLQLQLDSDPRAMAKAGHPHMPANLAAAHHTMRAIGFKYEGATIIGNFDEVTVTSQFGEPTMVELAQHSYSYGYRWGREPEEHKSISSIRIPADTPVWLHPRLERDTMHIYTNTKEKHMTRSSAVDLCGETQSISVEPSITTSGGAYLAFNPGADAAWTDQPQTVELIRNLAQAMGGTLESQLTVTPSWAGPDTVSTAVSGFGDEDVNIHTDASINQNELLAHILAFSALWVERHGQEAAEEAEKQELYAKVDEFRRALKPNAKRFQPTAELPEQSQQFQIDRYHRVTGAVENILNQDKEEPTS